MIQKDYNPYYGDLQNGTPCLRKPLYLHLVKSQSPRVTRVEWRALLSVQSWADLPLQGFKDCWMMDLPASCRTPFSRTRPCKDTYDSYDFCYYGDTTNFPLDALYYHIFFFNDSRAYTAAALTHALPSLYWSQGHGEAEQAQAALCKLLARRATKAQNGWADLKTCINT